MWLHRPGEHTAAVCRVWQWCARRIEATHSPLCCSLNFAGVCARVAAHRLQRHLLLVLRRVGRLRLVCELDALCHEFEMTFQETYQSSPSTCFCICLLRCGASNTCSAISSQTPPQSYCGTCASQWETSCPVERLSSTDPNASGSWLLLGFERIRCGFLCSAVEMIEVLWPLSFCLIPVKTRVAVGAGVGAGVLLLAAALFAYRHFRNQRLPTTNPGIAYSVQLQSTLSIGMLGPPVISAGRCATDLNYPIRVSLQIMILRPAVFRHPALRVPIEVPLFKLALLCFRRKCVLWVGRAYA